MSALVAPSGKCLWGEGLDTVVYWGAGVR